MVITLRKLKIEDAPLMLEWMHDESMVADLQADFASKSITDCERFIAYAQNSEQDLHLAITTDDSDEYLGTCSLKHIDNQAHTAEFGIAMRKCATHRGIAAEAMQEIIRLGFETRCISKVFWCVSPNNARAVRFYDKNGYRRVTVKPPVEGYTDEQVNQYIWYEVTC